jgi:serine/threonine-protein kinase RsbW
MEERADGSVSLIVNPEPDSTAALRRAVEAVAAENGLSAEATFDLKVAATEALANALRHTESDEVGVDVTSRSDPDVIQVEVVDRGPFRLSPAAAREGGRGLPLMVALADEVEFASRRDGTRVRIRMRVDRD